MKEKIQAVLDTLEKKHDCRNLFAVEGGSRAWGFASPDSDYDVRAVYVRPAEWYLRLDENPPDVWTEMLPDDLDISAWDIRKAFVHLLKSNPAFLEWLGSPIIYRDMGLAGELSPFLPDVFNPVHAVHHYASMFRHAAEDRTPDGTISIKKLCYALRANVAVRWILLHGTMPPTEFWKTLDGADIAPETRQAVDELVAVKATTGGKERIVPKDALLPLLFDREREIRAFKPKNTTDSTAQIKDVLERIFFARALAITRQIR